MLSSSCKYGIRAVVFIATRQKESTRVGLKIIGEELKIPRPYLAKILQALSKRKILSSSKGPHGGFSIHPMSSSLSLMDIVKAIDGEDFFGSCFMTGEKCNFDEPDRGVCLLHNDLRKEKDRLTKFFTSKTIESLVRQTQRSTYFKI